MTSHRQLFRARAFTLLELLVVVGLIAVLSFLVVGALQPGRGAALEAAQATMANLLVAARTKAVATNRPVRLLVNFDLGGGQSPSRYLRYVALQFQSAAGWQSTTDVFLPDGVYVVPGNGAVPTGLFAAADVPWTKPDGSLLRSTALREQNVVNEAVNGPAVERWLAFPLSALGTTASAGDLILSAGQPRPPAQSAQGTSPVELISPEQVRGLAVSQYGVATLIDSRAGF